MSGRTHVETLSWQAMFSLLVAMFVVAAGFGLLLPILPTTIERLAGGVGRVGVSRHTGVLTATYTLALFAFAPLSGWISDRYGRRPILVMGMIGFAITTTAFAMADSLWELYFLRFMNGAFASSIAPSAFALVGDYSHSKQWRAYRFALLNVAGASGFLVGPMLGSVVILSARALFHGANELSLAIAPFVAISVIAMSFSMALWAFVPRTSSRPVSPRPAPKNDWNAVLPRLLLVSFVTAAAVGTFEVGLSLRATQVLMMDPYLLGLLFVECSLVMLLVQTVVFSPLIKPEATRWLISPALAILGASLIVVPLASAGISMVFVVGTLAASAGVLSPIATYWISLAASDRQGAALGRQTAAASLGQAVGSAAGGLLFNSTLVPHAPFVLTAVGVFAGLLASLNLPLPLARICALLKDSP